jgi:APA family basic amino acid/polyamine antiporter
MLIAGLATILTCTVVLGLLPAADLAKSSAPMADAAALLWGGWAGKAVGVLATVSIFGALNGWVLLQAQTPMSAARDGLFPRAFAAVDARGTPWLGLLLSSGLATALVAANYTRSLVGLFQYSILLSTAAALLPYAMTAVAWWKLNPDGATGPKLVAIGAFVYSAWALWGTGLESLAWGGVLLLAGLPVYLWQRRLVPATSRP